MNGNAVQPLALDLRPMFDEEQRRMAGDLVAGRWSDLEAKVRAKRLSEESTRGKTFPEAADLAMQIGGPCTRFATGIASLDTLTRGGLPAGRLTAIAGPPGTGKTTLAIDIARRAACVGWHVAILCHDEARETCMIRWGQLEGIAREDLEAGHPEARARLAAALRGVSVLFVDGDDDDATVEDVGAELRRRAGGAPSLFVNDGLQTVRAAGSLEAPSRREGIDAVVRACKLEAKRGSHVLATSEVSRGWYRSKTDKIDPLAAFKESGGIEYGLGLGLVLQAVEDEVGLVDVFTAKNRIGTIKPTFRLRQDFALASFSEVERPDAVRETADEIRSQRHDEIKGLVMDLLAREHDLTAADVIAMRIKRKAPDVRTALRDLEAKGIVRKPAKGEPYRLTSEVRR